MAQYATVADMISRWGQDEIASCTLSLDAERGQIDEERINQALADSSALIDSYLQRRYVVPVSPVLDVIIRACCILARYDLALGSSNSPSDQIKQGRADTLKWLVDLGAGKATLDIQVKNDSSDSWSSYHSRPDFQQRDCL